MGYRTLSLDLVLRALFLDDWAFEQLRDDDNPFVEGLFLVVILAILTAVLVFIGQLLGWLSVPRLDEIKTIILNMLQQMSWWGAMSSNPEALAGFQRSWDLGWQIFPTLFGAPDPRRAALDILAWPVLGIVAWLVYGALAHLFARLFHGVGTLNQTLGTTALAFTPMMFQGLRVIPFVALAGFIGTWQLLLRYKAIRSAHRLGWAQAMWATILPFAVLLILALLLGGSLAALTALIVGAR
jgi:hypothetical protein